MDATAILGWVTSGSLGAAWVYKEFKGRKTQKISDQSGIISNAMQQADLLIKDIEYLRSSNAELIKQNREVTEHNKALVETNKSYSQEVHELKIQVQRLTSEIEKWRILKQ